MSLTLAHDRTVVLVIECQNDLIHESNIGSKGIGAALAAMVRERDLIGHVKRILEAARAADVPVVYVNKESKPGIPVPSAPIFRLMKQRPLLAEGSWGAEVHPALQPRHGDYVIRRFLGVDAACDSSLFGTLQALGRTTLVAMGVSTNFAVEGTVRGAVDRLLEVVVPEDCCASVPHELHRFSIERILPLLGTVTTSDEVVTALIGEDRTPEAVG
jgi:ureidoacrylate peracid hydrolase